jgi:MYXO-CTERM domain-containing protein
VVVGGATGPGAVRRAALPVLALAVGLAVPGRTAAQGPPAAPEPVRVAEAFTAAWNAHDLPAVLALFAPDAVVRERRGEVPPEVWDTSDPQVVRAYLEDTRHELNYNPSDLIWVTGHPEIAASAADAFAHRHRFAAAPYRAAGDTVSWSYRASDDAAQLLSSAGPLEGDAEAVVRGGRIAVLTLVVSPESVRRQQSAAATVIARKAATLRAAPAGDGPGVPRSGPPRGATEPTGAAWPLGLGGLALLAAAVALRRRRRR